MSKEGCQRAVLDSIVGVVDTVEVGAVHSTLGEHTEIETHVPTEVEAPNLEVLGTVAAALGRKSSMLSFGWAMTDRGFTAGVDGFYYNPEGVKYCRSGEGGQFIYKHVISVLQEALDGNCVLSPLADAMVRRALDYVTADTPPELRKLMEGEMLTDDVGEEVKT